VASAGLDPTGVHPLAVQVMAEVGLDLAAASSKALSDLPLDRFDTVVTLCDEAACLQVPAGGVRLHWPIPDPVPHAAKSATAATTNVRLPLPILMSPSLRDTAKTGRPFPEPDCVATAAPGSRPL